MSRFTCQSLHPGALVDAQVVVDDLQDVSQEGVHVLPPQRGAAAVGALRVVLWTVFPPVGHVAAQHGQHHLQEEQHQQDKDHNTAQLIDAEHMCSFHQK